MRAGFNCFTQMCKIIEPGAKLRSYGQLLMAFWILEGWVLVLCSDVEKIEINTITNYLNTYRVKCSKLAQTNFACKNSKNSIIAIYWWIFQYFIVYSRKLKVTICFRLISLNLYSWGRLYGNKTRYKLHLENCNNSKETFRHNFPP